MSSSGSRSPAAGRSLNAAMPRPPSPNIAFAVDISTATSGHDLDQRSSSSSLIVNVISDSQTEMTSSLPDLSCQSADNDECQVVTNEGESSPHKQRSTIGHFCWILVVCFLPFVVFSLISLLLFLFAAVAFLILQGIVSQKRPPTRISLIEKTGIIYKLDILYESKTRTLQHRLQYRVVMTFLLLTLFISVGITKRKEFVWGFPLSKWMFLLAFITCGRLVTTFFFAALYHLPWERKDIAAATRYLETGADSRIMCYYIFWLTDPLITVFHTAILLLIWSRQFGYSPSDNNDSTQTTGGKSSLLTWTFVSLFIGSVLLFIKKAMLLKWRAESVYERFSERIIRSGSQLYFLALICGLRISVLEPDSKPTDVNTNNQDQIRKRDRANRFAATLYDLQEKASCFQDLALSLGSSRDDDEVNYIDELVERCKTIGPNVEYISKEDFTDKFKFEESDAYLFIRALQEDSSDVDRHQVPYDSFQMWMVNVHNNSLTLGYTLLDAYELEKYLNRTMNVVIAVAVFITWLLLTEIATTKVLIVVASPLLAISFIFGDMCKRIFEGIIFTFVSHPFVVGDICVIEGNELEVKRMGVLRTAFHKVGTKEEFSYSNSELASKSIINLRGDMGEHDQVELNLEASTVSETSMQKLESQIQSFLKHDGGRQYASSFELTLNELGNNIKMTICYQHLMNIHDVTPAKCLGRKRKQRSEFLKALKQILSDVKIKFSTI